MKPNTRIYPFLEGRDISRWTNPDLRYTGVAGNSLSTFGSNITTDDAGNASGMILIPNGYPPIQGSTWNNYIYNTQYDTNAEQLQFTVGEKTIRLHLVQRTKQKRMSKRLPKSNTIQQESFLEIHLQLLLLSLQISRPMKADKLWTQTLEQLRNLLH